MTLTRRHFGAMIAASAAAVLDPVRRLAAAVRPVRIRDVDLFEIDIPVSRAAAQAGVNHRFAVARVVTDAGIDGFSFAAPPRKALPNLRELLVGTDLFAVERHLKAGLLKWGGVEHAVWDAIGKIAGQPVYRLLGGSKTAVKAYLTCVWKGNSDQSQVPFRKQAEMALKIKQAGFKGMKIRVWRPNPMDDVEACREIIAAVGRDFSLMFDRTAQAPEMAGQHVWDYDTGLKVAQALQQAGAHWLEEPFARDDYHSPARLAAAVEIPITGGEGYTGLEPYRQCLLNRTYDILQPDGRNVGGILTCRKVAVMAEAFHVPTILHGSMSLTLAGWLQATLANGSEWQEMALITPPMLPQEQWEPALKVLKSKELFHIENGEILAPEHPGIGLDLDEDALQKYRVRA